jgi:hypothetical protein
MILFRIASFVALLCLFTYGPLVLFGIAACVYALFFTAYELLFIGLCIDALYGTKMAFPYYTIGAFSIFVVMEWIKQGF